MSKVYIFNDLVNWRREFGVTQKELANACGVSKNTISSIERYEFLPSLSLAFNIARFFNCSIESIFGYDNDSCSRLRKGG